MTTAAFELQPTLNGEQLLLRPLRNEDFDALFAAAGDPKIWEQHPQSDRYKKDVFQKYFDGAIKSGGAFVIIDRQNGKIIGSSRYYDFKPEQSRIAIGYTFIKTEYWGGNFNRELKSLMLKHAFRFVDVVIFEVGVTNLRSRKAIEKIGGHLIGETELNGQPHVVYEIKPEDLANLVTQSRF